jgi:glutathione S-transferase
MSYGTYADVVNTLEHAVGESDYLIGENFSAADVYLGSHIGWGMQFGSIEKRPSFESYWARLSARPAVARAREIDEALAPAP